MGNPFSILRPALEALATEARVLPATGQALEDQVAPDIEEVYDRVLGGRNVVQTVWESPRRKLYHDIKPIPRTERHLLRYFLDGSVRTYFIGTVLEHQRSSPVQLAQVGAAAIHRKEDGSLRVVCVKRKFVLLLQKSNLSQSLWNHLEEVVRQVPNLELRDTSKDEGYLEKLKVWESRSRGAHISNWVMREVEIQIAKEELAHRSEDEWLVVDGALGNEYIDWDGPPLIGVAKSFRRDTVFHLGTGPRARQLNLYSLLAGLQEGQRTCVFPRWQGESREGKIVFWYVRIRPQRGLDYPLMGVVKVEMPNPTREPVDSDLVDLISGAVIAERSVTPHGRDHRWHAHLYPIYMAERVIKNHFYSQAVLKAAIRWPELRIS